MLDLYIKRQHEKQKELSADEVDSLLEKQEAALVHETGSKTTAVPSDSPLEAVNPTTVPMTTSPISNRAGAGAEIIDVVPIAAARKRGPKGAVPKDLGNP